MGTYLAPDVRITDDWQEHKDRKPASREPGTDYALAYGSNVYAPEAGKVIEVKTTTTYAGGRWVTIRLDDGRTVRLEHLSKTLVSVGQRVTRGLRIARSGASANGKDWGVGAHVHIALWAKGAGYNNSNTIDFEKYVEDPRPSGGGSLPLPTPTPGKRRKKNMSDAVIYTFGKSTTTQNRRGAIVNFEAGTMSEFVWFPESYANNLAKGFGLEAAGPVTEGHYDIIKGDVGTRAAAMGKVLVDLDDEDVRVIGMDDPA